MTLFTYNRDIPDGPHNPSSDQPLMKKNTNNTDDLINVDHVSFNDTQWPNGYHRIVHAVNQGSFPANVPAPIANTIQLSSLLYTPDTTGGIPGTQFFLTNSGGTVQMTGTSLQQEGWAWVGGVLLQWGIISSPGSSGIVTFKDRVPGAIPFRNNCFSVQLTPQATSPAILVCLDNAIPPSLTQFKYRSTPGANSIFWFAVGN